MPISFEETEKLQREAFLQWSKIITDPVIPSSGAPLSISTKITGVSVSFAGDWLPSGRKTFTNVANASLRNYLSSNQAQMQETPGWKAYGELFLALHWKLYGRNASLMSHLLHRSSNDQFTLHVDLSDTGGAVVETNGTIAEMRVGTLCSGLLLKMDENKKFVQELFGAMLASNPTKEEIYEVAADLVNRFKEADGCLDRQYHDGSLVLRAELGSLANSNSLDTYFDSKTKALLGLDTTDRVGFRMAVEQTTHLLQLLYLYQPLGKDHVYLFSPKGSLDEVRTCFVVWSSEPIPDVARLNTLAESLNYEIYDKLKAGQPATKKPDSPQENVLAGIIGRDLSSQVGIKMSNSHAWLGHYLILCERLADVAVHEGKKLGFSFFVSSGEAASREIEFVSYLSDTNSLHKWEVDNDLKPKKNCESIISRLLGNYSFFQSKEGVIGGLIHCSWDGHLMMLGKLLDPSKTPETLTKDLSDAYLIRLEKNRDIKVFYKGALVLWRRGARWLVPYMYGNDYQQHLHHVIKIKLPNADDDVVKELCANAWELSHFERGGACFLVADLTDFVKNPHKCQFRNGVVNMTEVLPFAEGRKLLTRASRSTFQELAVQDGATLVDMSSGEVFGRRQIAVPMPPLDWENHLSELKLRWIDSHKILRWGTRHLNALRAALYFKGKAVLVTVSSDGDIHLFDDTGPVLGATYPGV